MCLSNTPRPTGTIFVSASRWPIAAPQAAEIHLLPTLWFRNTWSWAGKPKPALALDKSTGTILAHESEIGDYRLYYAEGGTPLFTENETNSERLFGAKNASPYVKDAFHRYVINGETTAVNPRAQRHQSRCAVQIHRAAGRRSFDQAAAQERQAGNHLGQRVWARNLKTHLPRAKLKPTSSTQASFLPPQTMTRAT